MGVIFSTIHGSRLYGLDHAGSDDDQFIVFEEKRQARQSVSGKDDIVRVGLHDFLDKAYGGSHQSVEALFSPFKVWEAEEYRPFLDHAVIPAGAVREKYMRTIKKFSFEDFKRRRHAVRLGFSVIGMQSEGRFNPRLSPMQIIEATDLANNLWGLPLYREIQDRIELASGF